MWYNGYNNEFDSTTSSKLKKWHMQVVNVIQLGNLLTGYRLKFKNISEHRYIHNCDHPHDSNPLAYSSLSLGYFLGPQLLYQLTTSATLSFLYDYCPSSENSGMLVNKGYAVQWPLFLQPLGRGLFFFRQEFRQLICN